MAHQVTKIFSKYLKDTDIKRRLAVPPKILSFLPDFNGSHAVKIHLVYGTRMRQIVCSIRKKGYKKPVFCGGWVDFVRSNEFNVGDELTLYKVQDEAGSFHFRVQVEKPARPSGDLSPNLSRTGEVDQTIGTSRIQACNFENQQEQLLKAEAAVKQEKAVAEFVDVAANAPLVDFVSHVSARPSIRIFGINASPCHEATSNAHFKSEEESKMKLFGISKSISEGEPQLHSFNITNEEREVKSFGFAEDVAMAYGTSQAVGDAYYKSLTEQGLSLDLTLGQPTPVNLDLTLAPPGLHGGHQTFCSLKTERAKGEVPERAIEPIEVLSSLSKLTIHGVES